MRFWWYHFILAFDHFQKLVERIVKQIMMKQQDTVQSRTVCKLILCKSIESIHSVYSRNNLNMKEIDIIGSHFYSFFYVTRLENFRLTVLETDISRHNEGPFESTPWSLQYDSAGMFEGFKSLRQLYIRLIFVVIFLLVWLDYSLMHVLQLLGRVMIGNVCITRWQADYFQFESMTPPWAVTSSHAYTCTYSQL